MDAINQSKIKMGLLKDLNNAINKGENYFDYLEKLLQIYSSEELQKGVKPATATSYLLVLLIAQNYKEAINKCKYYTVNIKSLKSKL